MTNFCNGIAHFSSNKRHEWQTCERAIAHDIFSIHVCKVVSFIFSFQFLKRNQINYSNNIILTIVTSSCLAMASSSADFARFMGIHSFSHPAPARTTVESSVTSPLNSIAPPVSTTTPMRNGVISARNIHAPFRSPAIIARSSAPATTPLNGDERKVMNWNFLLYSCYLRADLSCPEKETAALCITPSNGFVFAGESFHRKTWTSNCFLIFDVIVDWIEYF